MADIFISYKSERRPAARHLKKVLECYFRNGVEDCVWYDYGLVPGHEFEPRIMAEIAQAKVVLVLWCGMAVKSEWVAKEATAAKKADKLLPVRLESCALPAGFGGDETINLSEWDASPRSSLLDRLLDDIGRRIGREPVSRLSRLRELEEDWRGYGAPSLAHFALGRPLVPDVQTPAPKPAVKPPLGGLPPGLSPNLALHWRNAQQGDLDALVQIGWHYDKGKEGLPRNETEAVRIYKVAADQGHAGGQAGLGFMYASGGGGLQKDVREAARLYRLAADQGDARGQANLGVVYLEGLGVPKDQSEAVRLFKRAAEQGNALGQANLGFMYENGLGVPKDQREAARLYKLAADQGNERGQANLADMYEHGKGVPKNKEEAVRLYKLAARGGSKWAQNELMRRGDRW